MLNFVASYAWFSAKHKLCFGLLLLFICAIVSVWSFSTKNSTFNVWSSWIKAKPCTSRIKIKYFAKTTEELYSTFRCAGSESYLDLWVTRTCVFNDICYNTDDKKFQYFRRPHTRTKPIFFDVTRGNFSEFSPQRDGRGFSAVSMPRAGVSWAPHMVDQMYPTTNFTKLTHVHRLWKESYYDGNFGHVVWEEFGSVFYSMMRMKEFDDAPVLMHTDNLLQDLAFVKLEQQLRPVLTPNQIVRLESYTKSFGTKYICFDRFMVGGHLHLFETSDRVHHETETLLYAWRNKIIAYHGLDPEAIPTKHRVLLVNKTSSVILATGRRKIANLAEIKTFINMVYPTIPVEVVEWQRLPLRTQLQKLLQTTILITPAGAVSAKLPFLPRGAHAIVSDVYIDRPFYMFNKGDSASLERQFFGQWPHVKKNYYQIYNISDIVWDQVGATDPQHYGSTVMNLNRLKILIDKAIEDME